MGPYEKELQQIAAIGDWRVERVQALSASVEDLAGDLVRLVDDLGWSGSSATAAGNTIEDIRGHCMRVIKATGMLDRVVSESNRVREAAVVESQSLPSTFIPQWVHDAAKNGGETFEFMGWYFEGVQGSLGAIEEMMGNDREREAARVLDQYQRALAKPSAAAIDVGIEVVHDPQGNQEPVPEPPAPGGPGGPGGPSGYPRSPSPSSIGGGPSTSLGRPDIPTPPEHVQPPRPPVIIDGPPLPERPPPYPYPVPDDPSTGVLPNPVTGGPSIGGPGGPGGIGGPGGSGIGAGVGAGAGAAALAAGVGAKAAGLGGGAMGLAGAGGAARPGVGGLLGGGAPGAGGAAAGRPGGAGAGAAGGRGNGLLGGGQGAQGGAGAAGGRGEDKKKRAQGRGLGGPLAPRLEDEGEYVPRAAGTRAGGRDEAGDSVEPTD